MMSEDREDEASSKTHATKNAYFKNPREETRSDALWGLFLYSALMFTSPVIVYFGAKNIAETHFEAEPPWSLLGPAIAAIATANGVIVLYIMKAFRESSKERVSTKKSN